MTNEVAMGDESLKSERVPGQDIAMTHPSRNEGGWALERRDSQVAIDVAQVLAAHQALLKNMTRKIDALETTLRSLEALCVAQARLLETAIPRHALLMTPAQQVQPWSSKAPALTEDYYAGFSWIDRWFFPHRMRRSGS